MRLSRRALLHGLPSAALSLSSVGALSSALVGCSTEPRLRAASQRAPAAHAIAGREVATLLPGLPTQDGAGVSLTRAIGSRALEHLDPFLLLDELHSDEPDAYIRGFPDHPHRGFETITIMLEGRMRHRDSRGGQGLITGGGIQWMTAGRGIVHSEMPEQERGMLWGFQLWLNLPRAEKMCPQQYQDLAPERIAEESLAGGGILRAIAGDVLGVAGPVEPRGTEPVLFTAVLRDEAPLVVDLPRGHSAFLYVPAGEVEVGPERRTTRVPQDHLAVLGAGNRLTVRARRETAAILVAAARPLREPIARRGPFVMSTEEELRQAFEDYRNGTLG
ncbi:MAG: pirin family protein [Deltaproteobacteria bacterium]|jgi:redox-sensitive bicupin YhaK (pirin superfamily)